MKKIINGVIALVVAAALVITAGIGSSWFTNFNVKTWFNNWGKGEKDNGEADKPNVTPTGQGAFLITPCGSENDIMTISAIPFATDPDSVYVTITTDPVETDDTFTWSSSAPENVSVTASADGRGATVKRLAEFGEQVTITAKSNETDIQASVVCDYVKRLQGISADIDNNGVIKFSNTPTTYNVTVTPEWSVGTITPELTVSKTEIGGHKTISEYSDNDEGTETIEARFRGDDNSEKGDRKSFVGTTFSISDITSVWGFWAYDDCPESIYNLYYNNFRIALNNKLKTLSTGGNDGFIEAYYTVSFKGVEYASGSVKKNVAFNADGLKIYASDITPDNPSIIF